MNDEIKKPLDKPDGKTQGATTATPNTGEVEYLPAATSTPKPDVLKADSDVFQPVAYGRVNENRMLYPSDELIMICEIIGLKKANLTVNKLKEILFEYFITNPEFLNNKRAIATQFLKKIR
jgi:hypothetical protein